MKKRLLSILMLCGMVLSLLPMSALAAPDTALAEETVPVEKKVSAVGQEGSAAREDDLFYQYMLQQAGVEKDRGAVSLFSTGDERAFNQLSPAETNYERMIYESLLADIQSVADGSGTKVSGDPEDPNDPGEVFISTEFSLPA